MPQILQIKITLQGSSKPPIWRQVQIPANINFQQLHAIIQGAMGWTNSHLHQFHYGRASNLYIGLPSPYDPDQIKDGSKIKIKQYLNQEKDRIYYLYDFGDNWEHLIEVQKVMPASKDTTYPHLLKGKGACPLEDCGGIWGYYNMVEAINNPDHEEHETYAEWSDIDFWDVNNFDLEIYRKSVLYQYKNARKSYP